MVVSGRVTATSTTSTYMTRITHVLSTCSTVHLTGNKMTIMVYLALVIVVVLGEWTVSGIGTLSQSDVYGVSKSIE